MHAKDAVEYTISDLCRLFGVSKQAYFKYDEDKAFARSACASVALEFVLSVRSADSGIEGKKLYVMYRRENASVSDLIGRDAFYRLIVEMGLKIRKKNHKPRTTGSTHGLPTYPNLIKGFIPIGPNQLWASYITYLLLRRGGGKSFFCFLSLVLDAYTEEIIGWSVGSDLSTRYPVEALKMALRKLDGIPSDEIHLIHHSDRGVQYASHEYIEILEGHHIAISMTENGNPKDNAQAERINSTMKNELLKGIEFHHIGEVVKAVADAVVFYNSRRPHMSIDYMTPQQASCCSGPIKKCWYSWRDAAIKRNLKENKTEVFFYWKMFTFAAG